MFIHPFIVTYAKPQACTMRKNYGSLIYRNLSIKKKDITCKVSINGKNAIHMLIRHILLLKTAKFSGNN